MGILRFRIFRVLSNIKKLTFLLFCVPGRGQSPLFADISAESSFYFLTPSLRSWYDNIYMDICTGIGGKNETEIILVLALQI